MSRLRIYCKACESRLPNASEYLRRLGLCNQCRLEKAKGIWLGLCVLARKYGWEAVLYDSWLNNL